LRAVVTDSTIALLLLVVVVVAVAAFGTRVAGAVAALSAAAWFGLFFTQHYQRYTIDDPADIQAAVPMLLVGLVVSQLTTRVR
jgi:K+-sensing histidine kinase KdpD